MKAHKFLFSFTMIFGSLISMSSYSWLSMWMGLEINLISFIPLILVTNMKSSTESSIKYFITQSAASTLFLMSIITMLISTQALTETQTPMSTLFLTSAMMMKLGMPPFHLWFIQVMEGISWMNMFILMTWQKLAPMIILTYSLTSQEKMFLIIIIYSAMISSISGINQSKLSKILAFSSINHVSWMLTAMLINEMVWTLYFVVYSINSLSITLLFKKNNLYSIYQMINSTTEEPNLKILFSMNFLSLGGLPPFLGFFPKWITIQFMVPMNFQLILFILIMSTLITLFFYLRMCFLMMTTSHSHVSWMLTKKKNFIYMNSQLIMSTLILVTSLMVCTLSVNFY